MENVTILLYKGVVVSKLKELVARLFCLYLNNCLSTNSAFNVLTAIISVMYI